MIKEFIGTGKTVEEATQNAKLQLNAPEMACLLYTSPSPRDA